MIKVTVVYPNTPGSHFDIRYYCHIHIPLVGRLLGPALEGVAVEHGIRGAARLPRSLFGDRAASIRFRGGVSIRFWAAFEGNHERCSQLHQQRARYPNQRSADVARPGNPFKTHGAYPSKYRLRQNACTSRERR